jgi:AraC-like DNA-binding protein
MFTYEQVLSLLLLSGAIGFSIYNTVLYKRKGFKNDADFSIYALNTLILIHSCYAFLTRLLWSDWQFLNLGAPFKLFYGPLFFYIVRSAIIEKNLLRLKSKKLYLHLAPGIILSILFVLQIIFYRDFLERVPLILYITILQWISGIQMLVYSMISMYVMYRDSLTKNKKRVKRLFFDGLLLLAIRSIFLIGDALRVDYDYKDNLVSGLIAHIFMLFIIIQIHRVWLKDLLFKSVKKDERLVAKKISANQNDNTLVEKYTRSKKTKEVLQDYANKIEALQETFFIDSSLSIEKLSKELKTTPHDLSQAFSLILNTNYSQYVNKKRINFAVKLLKTEKQMSIADISFMAGFNSQASFYRVFKEHYNMSPKELQNNK